MLRLKIKTKHFNWKANKIHTLYTFCVDKFIQGMEGLLSGLSSRLSLSPRDSLDYLFSISYRRHAQSAMIYKLCRYIYA